LNTSFVFSMIESYIFMYVIFDFAQENGLKILELSSKNQRLETLFTEITA